MSPTDTPLTDLNSWVEDVEEKGQVELCKADFARQMERDRALLIASVRALYQITSGKPCPASDEQILLDAVEFLEDEL